MTTIMGVGAEEETELTRAFEAWWDRGDPKPILKWSRNIIKSRVSRWAEVAHRVGSDGEDLEQDAGVVILEMLDTEIWRDPTTPVDWWHRRCSRAISRAFLEAVCHGEGISIRRYLFERETLAAGQVIEPAIRPNRDRDRIDAAFDVADTSLGPEPIVISGLVSEEVRAILNGLEHGDASDLAAVQKALRPDATERDRAAAARAAIRLGQRNPGLIRALQARWAA
jgi:hypothetical protein